MTAKSVTDQVRVTKPTDQQLKDLGVKQWPIWTKEPSTFQWHYDEPETCYFLEGDVEVTTAAGKVRIGQGDLVTFAEGLNCTWNVRQAVRKHYRFGA